MQVAMGKRFVRQVRKLKSLNERDAVWACVEKLEDNPANPGLSLEKLDRIKGSGLWSVRVNSDIRIILHRGDDTWLILHVDHHDKAYQWAEGVKVERHANTGEIQVVHVEEVWREVVHDLVVEPPQAPLFADHDDSYLERLGVPPEAMTAVRALHSEDQLVDLIEHLPEPVWDRLSRLAQGERVEPPTPIPAQASPLHTPDGQLEFLVLTEDLDLRRVLTGSWEEWVAFLHPSQRAIAYGTFSGPCRVTGSAGTGKTVVAMHRARHLAAQGKRVLLTTYTHTLAANLRHNLEILCSPLELNRITVETVHGTALNLLAKAGRKPRVHDADGIRRLIERFRLRTGCPHDVDFLVAEWGQVVVPQALGEWPDYRVAPRTGRGVPLRMRERRQAWSVFEEMREHYRLHGETDWGDLCRLARERIAGGEAHNPFQAVVVDEAQDLGVQEVLLLKALGGTEADGITVAGDGGQRIYPGGFSLSALGIETRGRSRVLRVNYRTSEQIRRFADRVRSPDVDDLDGATEELTGAISLFQGPRPEICRVRNASDQADVVVARVAELLDQGFEPASIGLFAREKKAQDDLDAALKKRSIRSLRLRDRDLKPDPDSVRIGTMHRAKGLEFRAVIVVSVNDGVVPHRKAVTGDDEVTRQQAVERERQLLYVAITRARECVVLTWFGRPSPFLVDAGLLEDE